MAHKTIVLYEFTAGFYMVEFFKFHFNFFHFSCHFTLISLYKNVGTTLFFHGWDFYIETIKITMFIFAIIVISRFKNYKFDQKV